MYVSYSFCKFIINMMMDSESIFIYKEKQNLKGFLIITCVVISNIKVT